MSTSVSKKSDEGLIGVFRLGMDNVRLYGTPEHGGGECFLTPDDRSLPRINVGLGTPNWNTVVSTVLHETQEFLLLRSLCCFHVVNGLPDYLVNRVFILTHLQMDELCDRQAIFLIDALPKLRVAWKKQNKGRQ